jgi:hypothetical protein
MLKWRVPVDGSESALRAVSHMIDKLPWFKDGIEIYLLNVQHRCHTEAGLVPCLARTRWHI